MSIADQPNSRVWVNPFFDADGARRKREAGAQSSRPVRPSGEPRVAAREAATILDNQVNAPAPRIDEMRFNWGASFPPQTLRYA
jgi:hypothetical protein